MSKRWKWIYAKIIVIVLCLVFPCLGFSGAVTNITFSVGGKKYRYADSAIIATDHTVAETIYSRKINAPLKEKLERVEECVSAGAEWETAIKYCFPLLPKFVDTIIAENSFAARDSQIKFQPNSRPYFSITRSSCGQKIDRKRLYQDIFMALHAGENAKLNVAIAPAPPKITELDNVKLTRLISSFSTDFSSSNDNRKHNIILALNKINGAIIMPKEEFSFNKTVGARSKENGFLEAKIIMDGEYILGYGGGVCQASTTLYNAALLANMNVTTVKNHSLKPSYVEASFDAMVNSYSSDLAFVNDGETPVFIRATTQNDSAIVEFFGAVLPYQITRKSVEISRSDTPLDTEIIDVDRKHVGTLSRPGERVRVSYGHPEIVSEATLVYRDAFGRVVGVKKLRRDVYKKTSGIIAIAP